MAQKEPRMLTMEINHGPVSFPEGITVLRAAELNGLYIPSLCSHKDLSPFGGCRLCMVEIEGMRGYPLSCNTLAQEGMRVLTDTVRVRELRQEILELILSEHPSSCLICGDKVECRNFQGTIRKAGVSTGCRFCPNDGQCELQDLVERLGVTEIDFPIYYHGYEPEHDDPFYDRDYNICILCGRCVRMCQEVRGTGVLAFTYRGPRAKIGTAFGRSHQEAGCEFCGACVDVCPTGALADKVSKWDGKPDCQLVSTCPFCAIGCQLELAQKSDKLSKARASLDPEINDGQLCVKGRYGMPEVAHHFERAIKPMLREGQYFRAVGLPEALEKVVSELKILNSGEFVMHVSPDLSNESLFAAQKFVRECLCGQSIDSTVREELPGGLGFWSWLFSLPVSIKSIAHADVIIACGLDSRFNFSVVGTKIRKALGAGAKLVTIDPRDSNLARYTDHWLRPAPGKEGLVLQALAGSLNGATVDFVRAACESGVDATVLEKAAAILGSSKNMTVIVGPQVFHYSDLYALAEALRGLSELGTVNFVPLYFGTNARGALELGIYRDLGPTDVKRGSARPKVIYLVGEVPFFDRPDCDFLIAQDIYLPPFEVDAFLPASSFAASGGTLVNIEGRVQNIARVEHPLDGAIKGFVRPDWRIFADLAAMIRPGSMDYRSEEELLKDICTSVPGFPAGVDRTPRRMKANVSFTLESSDGDISHSGDFLLVAEPGGYRHRGIDISSKVEGLAELALEEGFRLNPEDIESLGLKNGEEIMVSVESGKQIVVGLAKADPGCPRSVVYYTRPVVLGGLKHRRQYEPLYRLRQNPARINVSRAVKDKS
jgi:formate dehydrogenase (NADP+) alpha subunit